MVKQVAYNNDDQNRPPKNDYFGGNDVCQQVKNRLLPRFWWRTPIRNIAHLAPIQNVNLPEFEAADIAVDIKREDLLCPFLGGNKIYKLHFHLQRALALRAHTIATFGGAYSNHIFALARVGFELGIKTVGIIRGERVGTISPTLRDAESMGMTLLFVSRAEYKDKYNHVLFVKWGLKQPGVYVVPEGGGDMRGALGMAEYWRCVQAENIPYDAVVIAAGTGGSMAGIMAASTPPVSVHGILMLKGGQALTTQFSRHTLALTHYLRRNFSGGAGLEEPIGWQLHTKYHQGGYGPATGESAQLIRQLSTQTGIPLDPVYTGKMLSAVQDLARQSTWRAGQRILLIHSGGLQGARTSDE